MTENYDSGAMVEAVKSDMPILFFNPYTPPTKIQPVFANRVKHIPVTFDDKNRPVFDKQLVADFLKQDQHTVKFDSLEKLVNFNFPY